MLGRLYLTYEGLKHAINSFSELFIHSLYLTYEGLKPYGESFLFPLGIQRLYLTYEGLKLVT